MASIPRQENLPSLSDTPLHFLPILSCLGWFCQPQGGTSLYLIRADNATILSENSIPTLSPSIWSDDPSSKPTKCVDCLNRYKAFLIWSPSYSQWSSCPLLSFFHATSSFSSPDVPLFQTATHFLKFSWSLSYSTRDHVLKCSERFGVSSQDATWITAAAMRGQ